MPFPLPPSVITTPLILLSSLLPRIVRDYEKYIARQFRRGTSRQELNVSWLKKNELELKRHVQELRDNIRTNWTTTGQELGRELRAYWPTSRPQSPSRQLANPFNTTGGSGGLAGSSPTGSSRPPSIRSSMSVAPMNEFVYGYTLGLIGGVKGWVSGCSRCVLLVVVQQQ